MKSTKILIVSVVSGFLGYMAYAVTVKYVEKESLRERISTIPSFCIERLQDGVFTEGDLAANRPLILMYFSSSCEFCRIEARQTKEKLGRFNAIQLVFVSTEEKADIENFAEVHGLSGHPNVVFLQDANMEFSKIFGTNTVPAAYLYDKDRRLIKEFRGAVGIESMLEAFQNRDINHPPL